MNNKECDHEKHKRFFVVGLGLFRGECSLCGARWTYTHEDETPGQESKNAADKIKP